MYKEQKSKNNENQFNAYIYFFKKLVYQSLRAITPMKEHVHAFLFTEI